MVLVFLAKVGALYKAILMSLCSSSRARSSSPHSNFNHAGHHQATKREILKADMSWVQSKKN